MALIILKIKAFSSNNNNHQVHTHVHRINIAHRTLSTLHSPIYTSDELTSQRDENQN